MQNLKHILVIIFPMFLFAFVFLIPIMVGAQGGGFIPCDGPDCHFPELVKLGRNIMDFLFKISIPLTAITISYAGFLMLASGGDSGKVSQGKEMFTKVVIGFLLMLSAWLIVRFIATSLLNESFLNSFGIFS